MSKEEDYFNCLQFPNEQNHKLRMKSKKREKSKDSVV